MKKFVISVIVVIIIDLIFTYISKIYPQFSFSIGWIGGCVALTVVTCLDKMILTKNIK